MRNTLSYIMTTNISCYTSSHIIRNTLSYIMTTNISCYTSSHIIRNKYYNNTSSRIMRNTFSCIIIIIKKINIVIIHFLVYQKQIFYYTSSCIIKYLMSLYKMMYNDIKYFYYTSSYIIKIFIVIILHLVQ